MQEVYTGEQIKGLADEAIQVLGKLNWDQAGFSVDDLRKDHPLKPVFEALAGIKDHLDQLLQDKEKYQKSLQGKEERYRTILENIEDGYYEVDLAGNLLFFNPSFCRILGYDQKELLGMNNRAYMDPETDRNVFLAFQGVYQSGCSLKDLEYYLIGKDGTRKDLEVSVSLIRGPEDNPVGFRGIARDISRRKEIELELKRNKENLEEIVAARTSELARTTKFFEDIFNSSLDGIITTTLQGTILYVSPRIRDILGYERTEVMGKKFQDFFGKEAGEAEKIIEEVLEKEEIESYALESKKKNGEAIVLNLSISLLKHDNGEVIGITSRFRDVTEEKKMTAALEQAKKRAEAANRAKSQFLANMSHEIRTPLNGILGMAELCLETELDKEQKHYIGTIRKEADSLLGIINQILDFSKIEAGKAEIDRIPFELRNLFGDVAHSFSYQIRQKGLEFISYISPETPDRLEGDAGRLRQVLKNLIGNAIKFTAEGKIVIKAEPVQELGDRIKLRFMIKDTGIGIPTEKQALIFESFTQADGSTTRRYGGTGLGLTISKQLAELMGGEIGIESEEGQGSTFWFTAFFLKLRETGFEMRKEVPLDQARVLVVNDIKSSRQILVETLKSWGALPAEAEGINEALELLKGGMADRKPLALVLIDLNRPGMTEWDFAREMRREESLSSIPIIILTSGGTPGDGKTCRDLGIAGYLTKPIGEDILFKAIQTVLDRSINRRIGSETDLVTKHSISERERKEFLVLLVEDYPTNQEIAKRHLEQAGYQVELAENGLQALESFKQKPYDLIFMDVQMPIMDGYQATKAIREIEAALPSMKNGKDVMRISRIPIIAMTAHAMKEYKILCLEAGMDDFISKPLTRKELLAMAAKWANPRSGSFGLSASTLPFPTTADQATTSGEIRPTKPFDLEKAVSEFEGDKEFLNEVIAGFTLKVGEQIGIIRQALVGGDAETIRKEAHSIKGGAANLTAAALSRVAFELESSGENGSLQDAGRIVDELEREFESFRNYWQENFSKTGSRE